RVDVVNDLRAVCRKYGFKADLVGGIYYLQGRLAKLVAESLVTGLFWLNLLFVLIALVVARSIRGAFAMIASLTLVPLSVLGGCVIDILANLRVLPLLGGANLKKRD